LPRPAPAALRALPNFLSLLRLFGAIVLPFTPRNWWLALVLAAGASDWIDGYLARRFRASSWLGGLLDGFTDKAFVLSALLTFAGSGLLEPWQIPLLLVRDACVAVGVAISAARRDADAFRNMDSRAFGKLATALIFALLAVLLLWPERTWGHDFLYAAAAIASTAAGIDYVRTRFGRITGKA
jgi:phosphatidylglycerophosphate synthase